MWIDTHEPRHLRDLTTHTEVNATLSRFAEQGSFPHLILYGPSGSGKALRAHLLIKAIFGDGVDKLKTEIITLEGSTFEFQTTGSNYHTQIFAPDLGFKDRECIQIVIKQLAGLVSAMSFAISTKNIPKFRVFVIHEAHCLTLAAQASLRRTLERFTGNARMILLTERLSSIIAPLKSRCFCIRVPAPSQEEVVQVLKTVCAREDAQTPSDDYLNSIATRADRNLRAALMMLQKSVEHRPKQPNVNLLLPTWRQVICLKVVPSMIKNQSPQSILDIREELANLLVANIEGQMILEAIVRELMGAQISNICAQKICAAAAYYVNCCLRIAGYLFAVARAGERVQGDLSTGSFCQCGLAQFAGAIDSLLARFPPFS